MARRESLEEKKDSTIVCVDENPVAKSHLNQQFFISRKSQHEETQISSVNLDSLVFDGAIQ